MKCFICGKEYNEQEIQDFTIEECTNYKDRMEYNGIKNYIKKYPLYNTCFRLLMFEESLRRDLNIIK